MKLISLLTIFSCCQAASEVKKVESRLSPKTQKVLISDNRYEPKPTLTYYYTTELEEYSDGTSASFLLGEINLKNINTFNMDTLYSIRVSIGWRDPQRDGYDVTSFNIKYDRDNSKI